MKADFLIMANCVCQWYAGHIRWRNGYRFLSVEWLLIWTCLELLAMVSVEWVEFQFRASDIIIIGIEQKVDVSFLVVVVQTGEKATTFKSSFARCMRVCCYVNLLQGTTIIQWMTLVWRSQPTRGRRIRRLQLRPPNSRALHSSLVFFGHRTVLYHWQHIALVVHILSVDIHLRKALRNLYPGRISQNHHQHHGSRPENWQRYEAFRGLQEGQEEQASGKVDSSNGGRLRIHDNVFDTVYWHLDSSLYSKGNWNEMVRKVLSCVV